MSPPHQAEICDRGTEPDVLARVMMLFHRTAIEIESIHMPSRGKTNDLKITITVNSRQSNARRMAAILAKLVDVLSVETFLPRGRPSEATMPRVTRLL